MFYSDPFFIGPCPVQFRSLGVKKTLIFPVLAISIFLVAFSIPDAHAVTFELDTSDSNGVCENNIGGTWNSNTATCTATSNTLNFITLQIDSGVTVLYNGASMINQANGIVDNLGTITINSGGGFSNIGPVAKVDNTGTINVNSGNFGGGGPIFNSGTITLNSGGQFGAAGLVNNTGIIIVNSGASIANSGTININSGGSIANSGTITINPGYTININSGIFNNNAGGAIANSGNIYSNNVGDSFTNSGTITNQAGGLMSNIGPVTNQAGALISNSGTITNNGLFNNLGTIDNNCGGIINHVISGNPPIDTCNTPPVANADSYSTTVNTALSVPALSGVLANDKDSDGDTITASVVAGATHGILTLNSDGSFAYTPNTGFVGSDSFQYQANDGHGNTATATVTIIVNKGGSVVTLSSSPNPSNVGQQVTFTATISPSTATGTVAFNNGTAPLGTVTISGGVASLDSSSFAAGTYPIFAVYSGDTLYSGNRSNTITETVNKITTTTALSSSQNPSLIGQSITFTATVSPSTATGTVTFNDSSTELGSGTVSGGIATFTISSLSAGPHSIAAIYSGDSNFGSSTSPVVVQTVLLSTSGKVTGGGHLGKNTNLGFDVSSRDGKTFKGHLEYNDKAAGIDLDSISVTQLYIGSSMTSATFAGNATISNNEHGDDKKHNAPVFAFLVNVTDPDKKGEHDTFSIAVTNSTGNVIYQNSGIVQGHIEIHNIGADDDGGHDDKNNNSH